MDSQTQAIQLGVESFYSSNRNEALKSRMLLWCFSLIGLAISLLRTNGEGIVGMVVTFLILVGLVDFFLLRQFRPGTLVVTLSNDGIESPMLPAPNKFLWSSIRSLSIQTIHDQPHLVFELSSIPNKKSLLNWRGSRPSISLAGLNAAAQDRLAETISGYLRQPGLSIDIQNPVREVREFMERVRALAPTPWVTIFLVVTNIIIWLSMLAAGANIIESPIPMLYEWGANTTSAVQDGQIWRLLSSTFLHGNVFHVVINMAALMSAGLIVERMYGHRLFGLIYFGSGIVGSALSLHFASQTMIAVGASGAIFGVTGALFVALFQHRQSLPKSFSKQMIVSLSFFITYSLIQSFTKDGIDTAAHIGGLLAGSILALIIPERLNMTTFDNHAIKQDSGKAIANFRLQRGATGSILILLTSFCLIYFAPVAKINVERTIHGSATVAAGMNEFANLIAMLEQEERDISSGKTSIRESDERSRSVFAPRMAVVLTTLRAGYLDPGDPRQPLLNATIRMAELMEESLAMQSVFKAGSDQPEPADPARAIELKQEMMAVMSSINGH